MKKLFPILLITIYLLLFTVSFALAADGAGLGGKAIVPCGEAKTCDADGNCKIDNPCNICYLFLGTNNVIRFLAYDIAMPLSAAIMLYGGFLWVTAGASEKNIESGKKAITSAVIGLMVVFSSYLIIATILGNLMSDGVKGYYPWEAFPGCGSVEQERVD